MSGMSGLFNLDSFVMGGRWLYSCFFVWFGLVSLFNDISTLFRLFNAKSILLEEQ